MITSYLDIDIDKVMKRTRRRPLPQGSINPVENALFFGVILLSISLLISVLNSPLSFLWILLGAFFNIIIYSLLLKRQSPLSIVIGGVSGGFPVLFGWSFVTNTIDMTAILISMIVMLWIPNHIWSLSICYKEDYRRAGVPMLPVALGVEKAVNLTVVTSFILVGYSLVVYFIGGFGIFYLATAVIMGVLLMIGNANLLVRKSEKSAWIVFKISSPYLLILFLSMIFDVVTRALKI